MAPRLASGWKRAATWGGASLLLGLVFVAYLNPDFAFTIANKVWACF
jgi:hypothetical protein